MKLTTTTTKLLNQLSKILPAVPSKSTLQVLRNVVFKLSKGSLELQSTDLDMYINTTTTMEHDVEFDFLIEARRLYSILSGLPKGQELTLTKNDVTHVTIKSGGLSVDICIFDAMEFPGIPEFTITDRMMIDSSDLKELSKSTYAVSNDAARVSLNGVYLHSEIDDQVIFVATCGHRLMQYKHKSPRLKEEYIIPAKALNAVNKIVGDEQIRVKLSSDWVQFDIDEVSIMHKLIEGPYPKYQSVIPLSFEYVCELNKVEILAALKEISSCTHEKTNCVQFSFKADSLEVSSQNQSYGLSANNILDVGYDGDDFVIGFNCKYLIDLLNLMDSKFISLNMNTPTGACLLLPVSQIKYSPTFLIMPLRLVDL